MFEEHSVSFLWPMGLPGTWHGASRPASVGVQTQYHGGSLASSSFHGHSDIHGKIHTRAGPGNHLAGCTSDSSVPSQNHYQETPAPAGLGRPGCPLVS